MSLIPLFLATLVAAQTVPSPEQELYRPTASPDRVRLTWNGDPSSTQAITWRTGAGATASLVQFMEAVPGPPPEKDAKTVEGRFEAVPSELGWVSLNHTAVLTGLKPETTYIYRVGDGTAWSEWFEFRTAAPAFKPFSFLYLGDAQNGLRSGWPRVFRRAFAALPDARFVLFPGDLVNSAKSEAEWMEFYNGPGWVNATIPTIAAVGNHEYSAGSDGKRELTAFWRPQFEMPLNGPEGLEETCYSLDFQGVRFIVLNSMADPAKQAPWLEDRLKNNPCRWTIVCFHHPVFSSAVNRDNPEVRKQWKPLFDKYRVALVLQGHDHTYARNDFKSVKAHVGGKEMAGQTVYMVTVSGTKMYKANDEPWKVRSEANTQLYQRVRVERDRIRVEAFSAAGELLDAFTLEEKNGVRRLIDHRPKSLERRRPSPEKKQA